MISTPPPFLSCSHSPHSALLSLSLSLSAPRKLCSGESMGNCAASKLGASGDDDDAVALCRDRKRLLKEAVARRSALAEAHHRYIHSLNAVAAALDLFVARHSAPAPMLLTDHPSYLRQTPSEPKTESFVPKNESLLPPDSSVSPPTTSPSSPSSSPGAAGGQVGVGCEYFFSGAAPLPEPLPPPTVFGWDFFNPFDGVPTEPELAERCRSSEEDVLRAVREQEGIPDLEEEEVVVAAAVAGRETEKGEGSSNGNGNVDMVQNVADGGKEEKGLAVMTEMPGRERELLDALRDIEDQFIRAYDSGKEVSKMLEATGIVHHNSGLDEMKDNSSKLVQVITWHRSSSSLSSSSYKSIQTSSYKNSLLIESKSDLFDSSGGMASGSHSQTLGRLYAWEKKLYEEVKAGDYTHQAYEKKCLQLRNQDAKGADSRSVDKTRAEVRDLYTRIWVALRSAETISKRIEKVRDEELHPQLIELLQGLAKTWEIMLESHETQKLIMFEVASFTCPTYGRFCSDSQRYVTLKLESELQNWRTCFTSYIAEQRAYVEVLDGWLSKFFIPDTEYYSRRSSVPSYRTRAPPLLVTSHDWLTSCKKLPDKAVTYAMKGFIKDMRVLWVKQGEEQQQKRRVDTLAKDLDQRVLALQKAENRVLESKLSEVKPEPDVRQRVEYLARRRDLIDMFRKKLEAEKAKHQECMQETQRATLNGFNMSLAKVFECLTEFSKDSLKLYRELLTQSVTAKAIDQAVEKPSYIEGSHAGVDDR